MIPLRDQEFLRQRFERELKNRLRIDLFTQKPSPIFIPGREECAYCEDVRALVDELASLSNRIALTVHDFAAAKEKAAELGVDKVPAVVLRGPANRPVRFFGLFSGTEFPNFIEVLIDVAKGSVDLQPETVRQLRRLKTDIQLQVLVTTQCPFCPPLVRTAVKFGLQSVRVKVSVVEIAEFPKLGQRFVVRAVPTTVIGEKLALPGSMDETSLVQNILRVAEGKPLSSEMKTGAATPIDPAVFQHQPQPQPRASAAGGLILPR